MEWVRYSLFRLWNGMMMMTSSECTMCFFVYNEKQEDNREQIFALKRFVCTARKIIIVVVSSYSFHLFFCCCCFNFDTFFLYTHLFLHCAKQSMRKTYLEAHNFSPLFSFLFFCCFMLMLCVVIKSLQVDGIIFFSRDSQTLMRDETHLIWR